MKISAQTVAAVSGLLDQVLELPVAEREPWLQKLGDSEPEMVPVLREMLAAREQSDFSQVLQALPQIGGDATATVATSALHAGERVGPYLLRRELGTGGMAVVWLAQRADGAFKRDVALKLPMLSRLRRDLADRFERERDILASLEHPNIARLYDAGVAEDGLPYLAMEYVEGQPITSWCDSRRYGIRERLKLFLQVLDAVQYAHVRQVIHRDLKPSNILVTEVGQVGLLDFGIAKLLIEGETAEETQLTRVYGRAFTVDYASPEQLRGESLTAASDIYALGVVLYELLTGNRPYQLKGGTVALIEQAIVNAEIVKPSSNVGQQAAANRSTASAKLARRLKGDLDAIVLKTLGKAAADRYASAEALADDLQRYLTGEPVEAQPDRLTYRIKKYAQRHRTGAAAAVAATCAIGIVAGIALNRSPATPPSEVVSATPQVGDKSIAVLPFVDMSEKKDQEYFSDGLSEALIDRLARAPDLKVIARTSSFQFKGKSEDVRSIASKLGVAHLLEGSVRKSGRDLRITVQLVRASDGSHLWSETYERKFADIFKLQDEISKTVAQALKVALNSDDPGGNSKLRNTDAYNQILQGDYFADRVTREDAKRAIEFYNSAIKLDPTSALAWARLGREYSNLPYFGSDSIKDDMRQARNALQQALRLDPRLAPAHRSLAYVYMWYDWDWAAAQAELQRAAELDPGSIGLRFELNSLKVYVHGQFDEAIVDFRKNLARDPLNTVAYSELGRNLFFAGRLEESETAYRKLVQLNPSYAGAKSLLAAALLLDGKQSEALAAVEEESDEAWRLSMSPAVYWALGRRADSDKALGLLERKYAAGSAYNIAEMRAYRGEVDAAFAWLDRAYRLRDPGMLWSKVDPLLRNLRGDPRYQALLVKMKLAE